MNDHKPVVLFLCTGNSCRSQMAEAFLRALAGDRYECHSAGTDPAPAVHPAAVRVMAEKGYDLSGARPKGLKTYLGKLPVAVLITVCDTASRNCPSLWPGVRERLHWPFEDPALHAGNEASTLDKFREVRDRIEERVREWTGRRSR
ncbi:MAG: arsenate reductase ArsC [Acidobacteriota bacterium]